MHGVRVAMGVTLVAACLLTALGCTKDDEKARQKAQFVVDKLVPTVEADVEQLRRGMPEGAKLLGDKLPDDPGGDLKGLQDAIKGARDHVEDLRFAKGTFFSFANAKGLVLRSEAEPDRLANANVFEAFPELKKALDPKAGLVETHGEMEEMRGVRNGPDVQWVVAHAVSGDEPEGSGAFVSGWSYRAYAQYLENQAKRVLSEQAEQETDTPPLCYVFLVKEKQAYGAPQSPDVNAEKLTELDLIAKTADGAFQTNVEITKRKFGVAAKRVPALGDDTAVAALVTVF